MTKADLMGNFDDIVADRRHTREACERHLETLTGNGRIIAIVAASRASHISASIHRTFSGAGTDRHLLPVTEPLERIVAGLNELQPTILQGDSSTLHALAVEARAGRLRITPRRIIRQTSRGAAIAVRCDGAADLAGLGTEIAGELARLGLESPAVTVTAVERIAREQSGKLRRFIPLASRQASSE
jgi:hypothetical protein